MTATTHITITNMHPHGFGFAVVTETGDQVFIPPHTAKMITDLAAGDSIAAVLVPNPRQRDTSETPTPWMAVKLLDSAPAADPAPDPADTDGSAGLLDEQAYTALEGVIYASNRDIAEVLGSDVKTVGNAMQRLYNAGRISRADVYHRVGQKRPSFLLYAIDGSDFLDFLNIE